ncbi:MAG: substrate-binding domain-containing protein, partial [Lachnospiraceae bacterium]|nr:substrate-binding domain-containing protein [Lachnospiraceae bacterium]
MIAFGILDALHEARIRVPADISVMGCDNTLFARMHKVDLTTIEHFVIFKGRDACDIIMKKIASHDTAYSEIEPISTYHVEYEPQLIIRGTTGYAREGKRSGKKK